MGARAAVTRGDGMAVGRGRDVMVPSVSRRWT